MGSGMCDCVIDVCSSFGTSIWRRSCWQWELELVLAEVQMMALELEELVVAMYVVLLEAVAVDVVDKIMLFVGV